MKTAFINWNNGSNGPFQTTEHATTVKGERLYARVFSRLYKIQVNAEGAFSIRKDRKNHRVTLLDS